MIVKACKFQDTYSRKNNNCISDLARSRI